MFDPEAVLAFVNTRKDRPSGRVEMLGDPRTATEWLVDELGYRHPSRLSEVECEELRTLRDSAQLVLRARLAGEPPSSSGRLLLNRASAAAPRCVQLGDDWRSSLRFGARGSAKPGDLTELFAALASATITLATDSSANLAECGANDCVVLFLRTDPRQHWHSERCGNRMRAARSYAKHKAETSPSLRP